MKIFFSPHFPEAIAYMMAGMMNHLDYQVVFDPAEGFDVAGLWDDQTFVSVPEVIKEISKSRPVINLRCTDISKANVEQLFIEIFGYSSLVDPTAYEGNCVKKPDLNSVGKGEVLTCPVSKKEEGFVYQKLIDSRDEGYQHEYRVPIIFGEIPVAYISKRDYPNEGFEKVKRHLLTPMTPERVFSAAEVEKILHFADAIGMDVGELDVLRDKSDGRMYIIDANKTASGYGLANRANWSPGDRKRMLALLAGTFEKGLKKFIEEHGKG